MFDTRGVNSASAAAREANLPLKTYFFDGQAYTFF
jgi:hypothetical protein